jgi:hypothetical protein
MMKKPFAAAAAAVASALLAGCSVNYKITPTATGTQEIRYLRGTPTVFEDKSGGSLQMTPLGVADGRVVLGLAAFNKGTGGANFGVENLSSDSLGNSLKVYTKDELEHEAKVRAQWQAAFAVLAGAAAAYAANQNAYSTTNGYVATRRGVATFSATTYNPAAAAIGTAAAGAATGYSLNSIKNNMDDTIAHLNGQMLQTTTVMPGDSYGGEVVLDMPKGKEWPKTIDLNANWNGQDYHFNFNVATVK